MALIQRPEKWLQTGPEMDKDDQKSTIYEEKKMKFYLQQLTRATYLYLSYSLIAELIQY